MAYINLCYHCEKEFEVQQKSQHTPENKNKFKKYCSKECRSAIQAKNIAERNRNRPKKKIEPVIYINTCYVCKTEFEVYDKRKHNPENKSHFKKCCSDKCVRETRSQTAKRNAENGAFKDNGKTTSERWLKKVEERAGMTLKEAVDLYVSGGMSINEITREHGFSYERISRELEILGIELNNHTKEKDEIIDKAIAQYVSDNVSTLTSLEENYGVTRFTLSKHLKDRQIEIRDPLKKYDYNEDFFEVIDTEEKAYWLGFLAADGSISESTTSKRVELGLKAEDREHIKKFVSSIGGVEEMIKSKIAKLDGKSFEVSRVNVACTKMANDLIDKGITPRKSFTLTFPMFLEQQLIRHFMRGYFDGDGNVHIRKGSVSISAVGNEQFIKSFATKLNELIGIKFPKIYNKQGSEVMQVYYYGDNARRILDFFYRDATVFLSRKRDKYLKSKLEKQVTEESIQ